MKRYLFLAIVLHLLFSCKSDYKLLNKNRDTRKIDLTSYKLYQFTMYRDKTSDRDKLMNPEFTAVPKDSSTVHEILYLLRDSLSNKVIYLTTYSHKYLYRNRGVFNDPIYKENLIFNDLDHLYLGKESREVAVSKGDTLHRYKFSFYSPTGRTYAHNLQMYFTEDGEGLSINKVTNNYARERDRIKNPYVRINEDVFSFKIKFKVVAKKYSFLLKNEKNKRTKTTRLVDSIYIQGTNVFLKLRAFDDREGSPFFRNRVRYFEPY